MVGTPNQWTIGCMGFVERIAQDSCGPIPLKLFGGVVRQIRHSKGPIGRSRLRPATPCYDESAVDRDLASKVIHK